MSKVVDFFLNSSDSSKGSQVVEAPAFSLTKVMGAAAVIVAPLATLLVNKITSVDLSAGNYVAIAAALLGFLAITSAADVLGRSIATGATAQATQAENLAAEARTSLAKLIPFGTPIPGTHTETGVDTPVTVLAAARGDVAYLLVQQGGTLKWYPAAQINLGRQM